MIIRILCVTVIFLSMAGCGGEESELQPSKEFFFGADLSYVNQILDHGGMYQVQGVETNPYTIFGENGTNLSRIRLWHSPDWTKEVYGEGSLNRYSDLKDVEVSIGESKRAGMSVLLDFHYSDFWADPARQDVPEAWREITEIEVLADSVYNYTFQVLSQLKSKDLFPEQVQIGNEINCGLMITEINSGFPNCNVCDGNWSTTGMILNAGIKAAREVAGSDGIKILLHVADPKNVNWWFDNIIEKGEVTDFDIIGISYYPLWHTAIGMDRIQGTVLGFREKYERDVMILETAYPWTSRNADSYPNIFGSSGSLDGFPVSEEGQFLFLTELSQKMIVAGALGIVYWEPAWITSNLKDPWGSGSSWENSTFFDFEGTPNQSMSYPLFDYTWN